MALVAGISVDGKGDNVIIRCSIEGCKSTLDTPAATEETRYVCKLHDAPEQARRVGDGIVKKCIACGEDVLIPFVGAKKPRPSARVPLCERPECLRARGIREAIASVSIDRDFKDKMASARRQVQGPDREEKPIIAVETSAGLVMRENKTDIDVADPDDIDRIKEQEKLDHIEKHGKSKKSVVTPPSTGQPRQPGYLKSVAHPVIPSPDPKAPYGRDENYRPIGVPDTTPANPNPWSASMPTKPPNPVPVVVGPVATSMRESRDRTTGKPLEQDTDYLRERALAQGAAFFDIRIPETSRQRRKPPKTIRSFRELLVMDRFEVAALFDAVVAVEWASTGETVLMDRAIVEQQAATLKTEIDELKKLLATRSAQWQKLHRAEDKLEKNDRERLKREETKELHAKEAEWRTLRSRLLHWETDPRNYVDAGKKEPIFITFGDEYPITLSNVKTDNGNWLEHESAEVGEYGYIQLGNDYDLDGYLKMLQLGDAALLLMQAGQTWDGWREWENLVITQAIDLRLIEPDKELIELYPGLGLFVPPDDSHTDYSAENRLALKTGGAQYGGSIYSGGVRVGKHRNYARRIENFDKTMEYGNKDSYREDSPYVPDNSDDRESWDPN